MIKRYLVISSWVDKKTGEPKSSAGEITEGINKNGDNYQITDTQHNMSLDGAYAVGTILSYDMKLSVPESKK